MCADRGHGLAPQWPRYHSRGVPLRPASLWGQEPSRKGTLRGTAQTFPATLAWPGRGLYLDLQEKPGERRLVTFQPCPQLSFCGRRLANGWPVTSPHRPSHPIKLPKLRWLLTPMSQHPAGPFLGNLPPASYCFWHRGIKTPNPQNTEFLKW